jgi:uncharacterized protein YbjT (DUF2867 family)/SAM-dependent methyltransferase
MTHTRSGEQVRAFVHGMWASVAASWGASADDVDQRAAPITERMLDEVAIHAGDRVLELASGPGGAGLAAARQVGPSGEVVISDVVAVMVDIARQRAVARGITNVRAEVLDLENIAEPDEAYDVVLCRDGMMFALDPARAAAEMHRILRPAGRAAVAVWAARQDNPWLGVLLDTITQVIGIDVPPPGDAGPVRAVRCRWAPAAVRWRRVHRPRPRLRRRAAAVAVVRYLVDPQPRHGRARRRHPEQARQRDPHPAARHRPRRRRTLRVQRRPRTPRPGCRAHRAAGMRTILITGATGTIGRAVIKILSQHDVTIRAATRHPGQLRAGATTGQLTPVAFDWDAPDESGDIAAAAGTMLVLPPAARHPLPATTRLLDSAVTAGVRHIVFLSTLGADFEPGFAFGRWALAGEQAAAAAGLPYTVLRPNSYMTNFLTMMRPGHDGALRLPWGDGACSFVDPQDVAAAAAQVLLEPHGHDGQTYELTGPEALNLHAIAAVLRAATGTHIHYVDTPLATVRDALSNSGMPQPMVTAFLELHSVMASSKRAPVTGHVRQVTGRPPRSFAGFAAEHAGAL